MGIPYVAPTQGSRPVLTKASFSCPVFRRPKATPQKYLGVAHASDLSEFFAHVDYIGMDSLGAFPRHPLFLFLAASSPGCVRSLLQSTLSRT